MTFVQKLWLMCTLLFLLVMSSPLMVIASDTLRYVEILNDKPSGEMIVYQSNDSTWNYHYEYNDRGRGPVIDGQIQVNADFIPQQWQITGKDYFKVPLKESFSVRIPKCYWTNKIENDSLTMHEGVYYPLESVPFHLTVAFKAGISRGKVKFIPSGTLNIKEVSSLTLEGEKLRLFEFTGLGFTPDYGWFDEQDNLYALVTDWGGTVRKGSERFKDSLASIQASAKGSFLSDLAAKMTHKPDSGILIRSVKVFDSRKGSYVGPRDVQVKNDKIEIISESRLLEKRGYESIDGTGKTLLPGLWEMHGHFSRENGLFEIAAGTTNLRDMGNSPDLQTTVEEIRREKIIGPDIDIIMGLVDGPGEFTAPTGMVASSEDEALRLIDSLQRLGYDGLKIYSSINPAWVPAMVSRAHMHGMRVAGHIPAGMTAGRAISEGFDEVTHLNMIALNFFGDTVKTQTMARFKLVGEKAWTIDVNGKEMDAFLSLLREKNVTVDPTIGIFEALMTYLPGNIFASYKPIYDLLPTPLQRIVKSGNYIGEEKDTALYRQSYETLKKILSRMYRERIPIVIGTDGGILQHELEIMSEIGIPNNELLSMVTLKAAEVSHLANLYGSIEEGKIANMILVDGDPVTNIADLRNISTVFKRGRYYKPKEMYQYFGWGYRY